MQIKATSEKAKGILEALVAWAPVEFVEVPAEAKPVPIVPPAPNPDISVIPKIDITEFDSPNQSARTLPIRKIVIHNTDNNSLEGSIDWLCRPEAQASAHLVIGRDGKTACIVDFDKASWHAGNRQINHESIGIELVADENHRGMTPKQESVLINWLKWMQWKYGIKTENIITHRTVVDTSCPCWVYPEESDFVAWKKKNL